MKDFVIFLPLTLVYLVFKGTLFHALPMPDAPLLAVFYLAVKRPSGRGAFIGFILGCMEDALTGGILGASSFALVAIFLMVNLASKKVHFSTPAMRMASAAVLSVIKGAMMHMVVRGAGIDAPLAVKTFIVAVITAAMAIPAFKLFARLTLLLEKPGLAKTE